MPFALVNHSERAPTILSIEANQLGRAPAETVFSAANRITKRTENTSARPVESLHPPGIPSRDYALAASNCEHQSRVLRKWEFTISPPFVFRPTRLPQAKNALHSVLVAGCM